MMFADRSHDLLKGHMGQDEVTWFEGGHITQWEVTWHKGGHMTSGFVT